MNGKSARDLAILTLVCALAYPPGLTTRGVVNWQEGIRLLAAQEMHERGNWTVPTIHGEPYLAKPPMIYWTVRALSPLTGGEVSLATLRLSVAVAAWLGVLLTYITALRLFASDSEHCARTAAFWASLMLASGVLYFRSARIGELDIWLVPFVTLSVLGIWTAYEKHLNQRRMFWPSIGLACLGAVGATLTKGPPGLVVILMVYGGIKLHQMFSNEFRPPVADTDSAWSIFKRRSAGAFLAMHRTHPFAVLGFGLIALWLWGRPVGAEIGEEAVQAAVSREAGDNLVFFQLRPWTRSLEAMSYGVGLGSLIGAIGYVWLIVRRPPLPRGVWALLGWCTLSWVVFCLFSSGTGRYLTPIWPGIAMFAGLCFAVWLDRVRKPIVWKTLAGIIIAALLIGQTWWYGFAPGDRSAPRSPTRLIEELASRDDIEQDRIASLDFWHAGLSAGARSRVLPIVDPLITDSDYFVDFPGRGVMLDEFAGMLRKSGETWTVLTVEGEIWDGTRAEERLEDAGLVVEPIESDSLYEHKADGVRTRVVAWRVRYRN